MRKTVAAGFILAFFASTMYSATVVSPDDALKKLVAGNRRFSSGERQYPNQTRERRTSNRHPYAAVIACVDSTVAVENLFDAGFGDLVVVRSPAEFPGASEMGALEKAVGNDRVPLILVLGHDHCLVMSNAIVGDSLDSHYGGVLSSLRPAVEKASSIYGRAYSETLLEESSKIQVFQSMERLLTESSLIADLVKTGRVKLVGGIFELESGKVALLGEHPMQRTLVSGGMLSSDDPALRASTPDAASVKTNQPAYVVPAAYKRKNGGHRSSAATAPQPLSAPRKASAIQGSSGTAPAVPQEAKPAIRFVFNQDKDLLATPRKPLYITLAVQAPLRAKHARVEFYAENLGSGKVSRIFALPRVKVVDGRAQVQFYWAAKAFRKGYLPKGRYRLSARVVATDARGNVVWKTSRYPEPQDRYWVWVK